MRSPFPFLALTLLAQLTAFDIASSRGLPNSDAAHASAEVSMLVLAGQANKGYPYTAKDGSYTIKFPGKPTEDNQTVQTAIGPIKAVFVMYMADQGKRGFMASGTRYNVDPHQYNVEKGLDGARDGIAKNMGATISHETKINYKGASGRQFYLSMKQGKGKVRLYVVNAGKGPMIYQTFVVDTAGKVDDAEATAFLDSLTFKPH